VDDMLSTMSVNDYDRAVELARLPEQVRGFGHVKEESIKKVRERQRVLLKLLRETPEPTAEVA